MGWAVAGAKERNPLALKMTSGPEDSHLRALPEPYLSIHTAPVVRPLP